MLNQKEILSITSISIVLAVIVSLVDPWKWGFFYISLGTIILVILINVLAKKMMAYFFQSEIEVKTWEFSRFIHYNPIKKTMYGHMPHQKLKSSFPAGFFLPLIIKFLSMGLINWMACLTFDVKGTIYRTARKWQLYQYAEVTEDEMAWIAFAGIMANIFLAIIGYMINAPLFAKLNLHFAFWSSIPLGELDGTKMFFGRKTLFVTAIILSSLGLVLSMVII